MDNVTCACEHCKCQMTEAEAVKANDANYCSDACANGQCKQQGCGHADCQCGKQKKSKDPTSWGLF